MEFYFSGITSAAERAMLEAAGVTHVLVDPWQAPLVADWPGAVALDSGAYAIFKVRRKPLDEVQHQHIRALRAWAFQVCDDVIGDPHASLAAWERQRGEPGTTRLDLGRATRAPGPLPGRFGRGRDRRPGAADAPGDGIGARWPGDA